MQPPASIAWLVDAVGEEEALAFIENAGGQRIWVPTKVGRSQLIELYGKAVVDALIAQHRGGVAYQVPLVKSWRAHILAKMGLSDNEICTRLGISWRQVSNLLSTDPSIDRKVARSSNSNQMDMFGVNY